MQDFIDSYYKMWFKTNEIYRKWCQENDIDQTMLFINYLLINDTKSLLQKEIVEKLGLPKQSISFNLNKMYNEGLIEYTIDLNDKRKKYISLSHLGRKQAKIALKQLNDFELDLFKNVENSNNLAKAIDDIYTSIKNK